MKKDRLLPREIIEAYMSLPDKTGFVPITLENGHLLFWYFSDEAVSRADYLAFSLGYTGRFERRSRQEVLEALEHLYVQLDEGQDSQEVEEEEEFLENDILSLSHHEAPIVKLVNQIIAKGVRAGASDIHFEPVGNRFVVRYRIDGSLVEHRSFSRKIQEPVISRIKVMANLDVAETRRPQDGVMRLNIGARPIDVRVSIIPSILGEKAVLRILRPSEGIISLEDTGMSSEDVSLFLQKASCPNGIILVTGPTGSGKTTTLYALLKRVATRDKHVITIEDPVEYKLDGITQVQVNPHVGLTFSTALKYFLRQDPDVIFVGEIRDVDTAKLAVSASLTGHLVLSTLHTNDAATTIARLIDMGVEPFLLASSLILVIGQRLVRRVCPHCAEFVRTTDPVNSILKEHGVKLEGYKKGRGCDACNGTGYMGRLGIFELLDVNEDIQELIIKKADAATIRKRAVFSGMRTMFVDGIEKVKRGITTPEEVILATRL